jgi:hypothetical protein
MHDSSRIGEALIRFEAALGKLEAAIVRCREMEGAIHKLSGEAEALRTDRTRLADELDEVRAKAGELADAGREAARRVETAMTRIRNVVGVSNSFELESEGS